MSLNYDRRIPPGKRVSTEPWPWHNKAALSARDRIDEVDALIAGITKRRRPGYEVLVAELRERREVLMRKVSPKARAARRDPETDKRFSDVFAKLRG